MKTFENECVGCPPERGCRGSSCPNAHVLHIYCDKCGDEVDEEEYFEVNGEQLCEECLKVMFLRRT